MRIRLLSGLVVFLCGAIMAEQPLGELLYNGIRLPAEWPPRHTPVGHDQIPEPPYLLNPPDVVPIDVGRQLFVDHFLIEETNLRRTFHAARYYEKNPVMAPDKRWEFGRSGAGWAMAYSDGVFFDPKDNRFKMWYEGENEATGYATSIDGVHWEKPDLDVQKGTNVVLRGPRNSSTAWLDLDEPDPARRFKFFYTIAHMKPIVLRFSPDGIHWSEPAATGIATSDRSTIFYNPFRKVWVYSLREHDSSPKVEHPKPDWMGRYRTYWEHKDVVAGMKHSASDPVPWVSADRLDMRRIDLNQRAQLYNLDAVAYESLLLGMFTIWHGQPEDRQKPNDVILGFSRDGFHWDRSNRQPFLQVSEHPGDWNYTNVQSVGGVCLVAGDRLYFYASGRQSVDNVRTSGRSTTGLAVLRRDGFASMDAGSAGGTLTTRPVVFKGRQLFVNADSLAGELRVEVLDRSGRPIPGFAATDSIPVRIDNTMQRMVWRKNSTLESLAGKTVRFRFHLRHGKLYSFWVSPDESGASYGYVAAGGPGFTGSRDTVGAAAYAQCCVPVW